VCSFPCGKLQCPACLGCRYQLIAGIIEERGIEEWFKDNPQLCNVLSFVVRTGNTFVGSLMWVDYVRLLGMQSTGPH
jgi:hypothetical protein